MCVSVCAYVSVCMNVYLRGGVCIQCVCTQCVCVCVCVCVFVVRVVFAGNLSPPQSMRVFERAKCQDVGIITNRLDSMAGLRARTAHPRCGLEPERSHAHSHTHTHVHSHHTITSTHNHAHSPTHTFTPPHTHTHVPRWSGARPGTTKSLRASQPSFAPSASRTRTSPSFPSAGSTGTTSRNRLIPQRQHGIRGHA